MNDNLYLKDHHYRVKISKKDVMDAIEYFWQGGYLDELTTDKKYYTEILLRCCAAKYKIELVD